MKLRQAGWFGAVALVLLLYGGLTYSQAGKSRLNSELIRAIERRDSARALALLKQGASPDTRRNAAHLSISQLILGPFSRRSRLPIDDPTALQMACGDYYRPPLSSEVIEEMVKRKANVDVKDVFGFTPLYYAITNGDDAAALALVQGGADCRTVSNIPPYETPLAYAIAKSNPALVEALLAHGADPNQQNMLYGPPLVQTFRFLRGASRMKTLAALLAHGADVNASDGSCSVPLDYIVNRKDLPAAGLLLDHGADINQPDAQGNTPLMRQIPNSIEETTQFLLARGARVNLRNKARQTPLMVACENWPDPKIIVPDLLRRGADVNARDLQGDTALIDACRWNGAAPQMVAQLLAHGADASARNAKGETALTCALTHHPDPQTIRLLRNALAKSGQRKEHYSNRSRYPGSIL